jgi:hypothetical protein
MNRTVADAISNTLVLQTMAGRKRDSHRMQRDFSV